MQKAKNSKICNFWTFWPVIQLIIQKSVRPNLKRWHINRVMGENVQWLPIWLFAQLVSLIKKNLTLNGNNSQGEISFQRFLKVYNTLNMAALISIPTRLSRGVSKVKQWMM